MTLISTTDVGIHRVDLDATAEVAATVAAAFIDDPVTRWLLPDEGRRRRLVQPMFELYVEPYIRLGETYLTAQGLAAAVWAPPGAELFDAAQADAFGQAVAELAGPDAERFGVLAETFEQHHPAESLYYCQFLATVPAAQGHGLGSALLRDMLARADREQMPAYHEATTPRNRALYERHGYETVGEFTLPDGPPLWPMWREPSAPTDAPIA
jgi:GNAT superfamily N-acetyltransferase